MDVLSASENDDKIAWYKNGGGSPPSWTNFTISLAADGAYCVYGADVDSDGRMDVLSASYFDDKIAWYRNGGGSPPTWTPYTITTSADGAVSVHAADIDSDGRLDVLSAGNQDDKIVWYKNGGGSPPTWAPYTISTATDGARSVCAADVDGNGQVDVLSASEVDDKVALYVNYMCPRGRYGIGGAAPCSLCPPGRYSNEWVGGWVGGWVGSGLNEGAGNLGL